MGNRMKCYWMLTLLLVSIAFVPLALSFQTGAPQAACQTLAPDTTLHGAQPQTTSIPYVLNLSSFYDPVVQQMVYTPDTVYNFILESTVAAPTFRGFLIQARLSADDSTIVGQFEEPPVGGEYQYGFCSNTEGSVTHTSRSEKSTITIPWTAPPNGTGIIHFGYAVVQTRQVYWANQRSITIAERPCGLPFYVNRQSNSCVRQCPLFTFGNHTTAQCQPFPAVLDGGIQANATGYFGSIPINAAIGTEVFHFRIVIDLSRFNNDLEAIVIIMVRSNPVEQIFKFSDGQNQRTFPIGARGGIDAVNASRVFPEITLIENRLVVFEDYVVYQEAPPSDLNLPAILDFDLNLIIVGQNSVIIEELLPFAIGTVTLLQPDPCYSNPCQNGGTCITLSESIFNCTCHPPYSGALCENVIDPCALDPCQNHGNCTNIGQSDYMCDCGVEFTGRDCETSIDHCALLTLNCNNGSCVDGIGTFTCECDPGYDGDFCDVEINECETGGCQNGQCKDLVNDFQCLCYPGWTGRLCETDIDYCAVDQSPAGPCDDTGAINCNDGNTTYTCTCVFGYTGGNCSQDINECEPNPCQNGGNCINFLFGVFECECPSGYSGDTCITDLTPCDPQPCLNGGTCSDFGQGMYSCSCVEGFTGQDCIIDLDFCQSDSCLNGVCMELMNDFRCLCYTGWTGRLCETDIDYCALDQSPAGPCDDTGAVCCNDGNSTYTCTCVFGYTGGNCSQDIDECELSPCQNGGNCSNFLFGVFECTCPDEYSGITCSIDLTPCDPQPCGSGGSCTDHGGGGYTCVCSPPYYLDSEINSCVTQCPLFTFGNHTARECQPFPAVLDRGIQADATAYFGSIPINTAFGTEIFRFRIIIDLSRFHNDLTTIILIMVRSNLVETIFKFSDGQNARTFAIGDNGGIDAVNTSHVFPEITLIEDRRVVLEDHVIYQATPPSGLRLPMDFDFDLNLIVIGRDSIDIQELLPFAVGTVTLTLPPLPPDHPCFENPCQNGGGCRANNSGGEVPYTCQCNPGFTGDTCTIDIDECETAPCRNGECKDIINAFQCNCYPGWTGVLCDTDIDYCTLDSSRFGPCDDIGARECIDGNSTYTCVCVSGYAGCECSMDIDACDPNPCQSGGICVSTSITTFECTCLEGYSGNTCGVDLIPCDAQPCGNGGTCTNLGGGAYTCECSLPYYLYSAINSCVAQCPLFTFGNHTIGQCQPFQDVLENGIQADATAYFGRVLTNATFGMEVFRFRIVIDLSRFGDDLNAILIIMVRSNLVETIFKFSDGQNQRTFTIGARGGIDAVNASRVLPEITLIENRLVVFEDHVVYQEAPPSDLELPSTLDFDLNLIVVGRDSTNIHELLPFAVGTVALIPPPDLCLNDPCKNDGTCSALSDQTFNCNCHPAYSGAICEHLIDPCALDPCQNGGRCTNTGQSDYMCDCGIEFTGRDCGTAIDHCALLTPNCNSGRCVDGVGTFTCQCDSGYTGDFCDISKHVTEAPTNTLPLDPVTFWVIVGIAAAVTFTMTLSFLVVCCYCTYFSARKAKRSNYAVQQGTSSMMIENSGAAGTRKMQSLNFDVKRGSLPKTESAMLTSTTTFI